MPSFVLNIAQDDDGFKLIWTGHGPGAEELWTPKSYHVAPGVLLQAASSMRPQLRELALLPERCDVKQFAPLLRRLALSGQDLFNRLLPDPGADPDVNDIKHRLAQATATPDGHRPDLKIVLETDSLFVPWGFVFSGGTSDLPSQPAGTLDDMKWFWLGQFRVSVVYGGSPSLPRERMSRSSRLLAIHEEMFSGARKELENDYLQRLDEILEDEPEATIDWDAFFETLERVQDDQDTILYVFGHSDGQRIQLSDTNDERYELTPAKMWRFRKRTKGTASVFLLNGCRTAAPKSSAEEPIAANFLRETRQPGYYGFIGTEAEVTNTVACRYGTEFLWRLYRKQQSVGEIYDELLHRPDLFPHNTLYTCFADRGFRLASVPPKGATR